MKKILFKFLAISGLAVLSTVAFAKKVPDCKYPIPRDVVISSQDFRYCIKQVKGKEECRDLKIKVFDNNEKRLPKAGHNQAYYEGRILHSRDETAGKRRLVSLVQGEAFTSDAKILENYFTADHYDTFCQLP